MKTFALLGLCILCFQSCLFPDFFSWEKSTVVTGTVYNSITGEKIAGLPIEVVHVSGFALPISDSVTTGYTDADGKYQATFRDDGGGYLVQVGRNSGYAPIGSGTDPIVSGKTNVVNLRTAPFKVLKVHIQTSKEQRNSLYVGFQKWDTTRFYAGGGFADTVRSRQNIDTIIFFKVYPMTRYLFDKFVCNRVLDQNKNVVNQDCIQRNTYFYFNFVDTANVLIE